MTTAEQNVQEKAERGHHPFSPSKLQHLEACPHYESRQGTHKAALDGTKQHSVTETGEDDHTLKDEQAEAAAECMDYYEYRLNLLKDERARYIAAVKDPDPVPEIEELVEVKLPVDDEGQMALVWNNAERKMVPQKLDCTSSGYVDRGLIDYTRKRGYLMDWKFGKWPVEGVKNNLQAFAYVIGMFRRYPTLETVEFTFKQPFLELIDSHTFYRADVEAMLLRIRVIVARKIAANIFHDFRGANPLVPVCNFCDRIGDCPEVAARYLNIAKKFHPMVVPDNVTPSMMHSTLDTQHALRIASAATTWADAYKRQVTDRVIRGAAPLPDGFRFMTKQDREVVDKEKFKAIALRHILQVDLEGAAEYGFGVIEELINDKAPRGMKKAAVEAFKKELEDEGAVVKGQPYTFLCAVAERKAKTETSSEEHKNTKQ